MSRLPINKETSDMSMFELSHNSCYVKEGRTRYRDYETDIDAREITKDLPTNIVIVRNSLEECREDIMIAFPFMTVFPRDKRDLPAIVETWF